MAVERPQARSGNDVPEDHLAVAARAHHSVPLQPHGVHGAFVTAERAVQVERLAIPHADESILGTRAQEVSAESSSHGDADDIPADYPTRVYP